MQKSASVDNLSKLLQANWTKFIHPSQLMRQTMENARVAGYRSIITDNLPAKSTSLSVTKCEMVPTGPAYTMEFWVEFTIASENSVVIGTHVYVLELSGELALKETSGTVFVRKT